MSTLIVGAWESSWFSTRIELKLWRHSIRPFNIGELIMVPMTNIISSKFNLKEYSSTEDALASSSCPGRKRVFIEAPSDWESRGIDYVPLSKYKHPENPIYIFGRTGNFNVFLAGEEDDRVAILLPGHDSLWSFTAASIVLYDRQVKRNDGKHN